MRAAELAATVIRGLLERTGLAAELVDDVLLGQCYPNGEAPGIGRVAALDAGLPVTTTGLQLDRRCGSGLQAIIYGAMQVQAGVSDVVLAGGVESMSQAEYYTTSMRWGSRAENVTMYDRLARGRVTAGGVNHPVPGGMLETAENLRREYGISRTEQDELALRSHQRAVAAQQSGRFDDEIVPVTVSAARSRCRSPSMSTRAPTPLSIAWLGCRRSCATLILMPPSRRVTPAGRTTAHRSPC
jgi:acetyl-CoA C-acetyltransferase